MFERRIRKDVDAGPPPPLDIGSDVLRFLAGHALPATPANYTLGHMILANANGLAARAADAVAMAGKGLSQTDADQILAAHGPRPEGDETDRVEMRRQARRLAELAAAAVADTGAFRHQLATEHELPDGVAEMVGAMLARTEEAERRLAAAAREVESLRQEVETARGDAARDALTGLLNRRGMLAALATRTERKRVTVAICDIDRFKAVNDRYGHVVGDRVLKLVSRSLEESCRGHLVSRWGGEEFLIVIEGLDLAAATMLVDRAREDLAMRNVKLRATDEPLGPITFSAGVARRSDASFEDVIRAADVLLYRAKEAGRNRVIAEDPDLI